MAPKGFKRGSIGSMAGSVRFFLRSRSGDGGFFCRSPGLQKSQKRLSNVLSVYPSSQHKVYVHSIQGIPTILPIKRNMCIYVIYIYIHIYIYLYLFPPSNLFFTNKQPLGLSNQVHMTGGTGHDPTAGTFYVLLDAARVVTWQDRVYRVSV